MYYINNSGSDIPSGWTSIVQMAAGLPPDIVPLLPVLTEGKMISHEQPQARSPERPPLPPHPALERFYAFFHFCALWH